MTPKERRKRFDRIADLGCIVCLKNMGVRTPAVIHHLVGLENGRAMGKKSPDENAIALCVHHHTGFLGIHHMGKRAWENEHGTQADYLEMTNQLLDRLQ